MNFKKKYTEKNSLELCQKKKDYEELEDRHKKMLDIFSCYKFERILDDSCRDGNFSMLTE